MKPLSLLIDGETLYDVELLRTLRGRRLSLQLQVLCVIGAHRFDELALINRLFPSLRAIYPFEPRSEPFDDLHRLADLDPRIKAFPVEVADTDGVALFNVASNAGESSSLWHLGSHRAHLPHLLMRQSIQLPRRHLDSVSAEHWLERSDAMIVDVHGPWYMLLRSPPADILVRLRLVYSEVSTATVYEAAGLLSQVEALLAPRLVKLGFGAINANVPVHRNVVFVAREDVGEALAMVPRERLRRASHRVKRRMLSRRAAHAGAW